jgi:hypothetical protein
VHFPDTRSRALTSSTMARKALPIAAGVVVASVASALLNRWLAKKAERRTRLSGDSLPWKVFGFTTRSGDQERRWSCCMATEA